ncbi:unnamed protein product [Closterium sp. NIES-54]
MYALSASAEGECYRCVPPDPGIEAAALGACECALPSTAPAEAFTLDSSASRCFFCDSTTLTPLPAPVPVGLADPSGGLVLARSSTVLPCPAVPSDSLSGLHLPSSSTNLVSTTALQDAMVTTTTPGDQRVSICTCTRTGRHLATFTRRPGSSLYTLATKPPQVAASTQVFASPPALSSLSQGAAVRRSSLLLVSPDVCSPADSPHGLLLQLRVRFCEDLPVLRLHSDRGGEFSSDLLRDFCREEGILQSLMLSASPNKMGLLSAALASLRCTRLQTTLAALGFAPSTADPSLFLRTDTSLSLFYVLVYIDDLAFATADTKALALVKSELQKRHTCTDLGELRNNLGLQITRDRARRTVTLSQSHMVHQVLERFGFRCSSPQSTPLPTGHSLSAPPLDEFVEPSGPYPELVGCLMYLMTCTRPDLAYPLSILARYVAP